ncbi:MAG: 3',5'-cyclic-AMP phosphodiesterase [Gammaproteobacteria bacterium]|nr:MAG: 3',5'-cyclic-AMP phosphodiesterase [Gammaproteobacteria bacterium]
MANNSTKNPVRVVQLSDTHLFESIEGKLLGLNTENSLTQVLELIRQEQPGTDLVLATGDLSQDGSEASYRRFHDHMNNTFIAPVYWLPGNHDILSTMNLHKAAESMAPCVIAVNNWQIIMLDSTIEGEVPGYMDNSQLQFLEQSLQASQGSHVMVCLHHQPVPVGCKWLDHQLVGNAEQFLKVIDRYDNVRALVWGHVHQDFVGERNGVKLMSVPSTCVQFRPGSEQFGVDDINPGYRWFDLYSDGRIETSVSRVAEEISFEVDYASKGY